jgi:hypothetical protein
MYNRFHLPSYVSTHTIPGGLCSSLLRKRKQKSKGHMVLKWIARYVVAGFIGIEIFYYRILCQPFRQYWALPVENRQCASYLTYNTVQLALNTSSYILIIAVPCAIVHCSQLPMGRRITLLGIFCMGFLTFFAAMISK